MSAISITGANMEYDAAQALLDLQSNIRESTSSQSSINPRFQPKDDMERAAKLFLSCIIASNSATPATVPLALLEKNNNKSTAATIRFPASLKTEAIREQEFDTKNAEKKVATFYHTKHKNYSALQKKSEMKTPVRKVQRHQMLSPVIVTDGPIKNQQIKTRNIATQTDEYYQLPQIETMEATIKTLCEKIKSLEAQIEMSKSQTDVNEGDRNSSDDEMETEEVETSSYDLNQSTNDCDTTFNKTRDSSFHQRNTSYGTRTKESTPCKVLKNLNPNTKSNDMVPIGDGRASVPSRLLRHINWNSYTSATRKLLTAVFSRRILATHSLTGKPSPAFPNKPAKKKLDPALVNDIVQTVVEKCCVPENVVRTSITTKCADESKMFRTRQKNVKKRKNKVNKENFTSNSSDSE